MDVSSLPRRTRREFLVASAGLLAAAAAPRAVRAAGSAGGDAPPGSGFHSRPDLNPPVLAVETDAPGIAPGYVFAGPFLGQGHGTALIAENTGEPVWVYQTPKLVMNFRVQQLAGKPVLTWWEGTVVAGLFEGECVIADTSYRVVKRVQAGNGFKPEVHEFLLTARGTALITINNLVPADLTAYGGPGDGTIVEGVIQEVDLASGRVVFEWHSLEHVGVEESALPPAAVWDYLHLNSIDLDTDGNLVVSARYPSTVYKLERTSGAVLWRLGGTRSDFELGEGAAFAFQHDARVVPGGLLSVFDDGADGPADAPESVSRAILLALDTEAMTATLIRSIPNPHGSLTTAMGNSQRLPDGGLFVGWGTTAELSEFGPDGSLRFDAFFPGGQSSYRAFRSPWVATPTGEPAVAAVRNANGSVDVYASWNGATEISHWQVRGGARQSALTALKTVARAGFETRIRLERRPEHVEAVALDRRGRVLGLSRTIAT